MTTFWKTACWLFAGAALTLVGPVEEAQAIGRQRADQVASWHAARMPWHAPYYHAEWGQPLSLVVPPTANMQTAWGWGVSQGSMTPIYHQYGRPFPGFLAPGVGPLYRTPAHPSHTDQFGVYYIRGPW